MRLDCSSEQWQTHKNLSFQFHVSDEEQWFLGKTNEVVSRKGDEWVAFSERDGLMDAPFACCVPSAVKFGPLGLIGGKQLRPCYRGANGRYTCIPGFPGASTTERFLRIVAEHCGSAARWMPKSRMAFSAAFFSFPTRKHQN